MADLPLTITGHIQRGHGIGRTLGFPTANLDGGLPTDYRLGIYAGWTRVNHHTIPSVIYWGTRPTFGKGTPILEIYWIDETSVNVHQPLTVTLTHFIRPDQRFGSKPALIKQMRADVEAARACLRLDWSVRTRKHAMSRILMLQAPRR